MHEFTLIPGLACDAEVWREQAAAIAAHAAVHLTDVHTRHATLPEMAAALLAERPGELRLCGTSMGGMLALEVVRQAPQRVKALALLASSARPDTPQLLELRSDAIRMFESGRMREVLEANVFFAFDPAHAETLAPAYLAMIERAGAAQLIAQNRAVMARRDYRPMLAGIDCPVLVACGESDLLTPPECSRELAAMIPGATLELLPRCGHMLTLEQPARVSELLLGWIGRLPQPR